MSSFVRVCVSVSTCVRMLCVSVCADFYFNQYFPKEKNKLLTISLKTCLRLSETVLVYKEKKEVFNTLLLLISYLVLFRDFVTCTPIFWCLILAVSIDPR